MDCRPERRAWLAGVEFEQPSSQRAFEDYRGPVGALMIRREQPETEIGDFTRFRRPAQVLSSLGVVPSEHRFGQRQRRGPITKSGSQHALRLLVEAAWHHRRAPRVAGSLARHHDQ
jgi:transposase